MTIEYLTWEELNRRHTIALYHIYHPKEKTMKDYLDIAIEAELTGDQAARYLKFMHERWADTEEQKCADGYALEWAIRFRQGREFFASDPAGRRILIHIDPVKYMTEHNKYFGEDTNVTIDPETDANIHKGTK